MLKDIQDLIRANVISEETAQKIQEYYSIKEVQKGNRLFAVFGVLGAVLVGLGIILILAHNWDNLSVNTKAVIAFIPLIIAQFLCGFSILKKENSTAWRESSAAFLFLSVGATISLISQIYHIPGNISTFTLTWMLLCVPLVYLLRSSITSLFYIIGITYYASETGYWTYQGQEDYLYWILILLILPHYYKLYKKQPKSNFIIFHHWLLPLSLISVLGTLAQHNEELMFIAYFSLLGIFYLIGSLPYFQNQKIRNNSYLVIGSLGIIGILLSLSFDWFWKELQNQNFDVNEWILSPEFIVSIVLSLAAIFLLTYQIKRKSEIELQPLSFAFLVFIIIFIIGLKFSIAILLINLIVFVIGILIIRKGATINHLGILNYGLLIITALVACRFFDERLSFVLRGVLFVSVGIGFFLTNYYMLKKRKTNEK